MSGKTVPYSSWGKMIDNQPIRDKNGDVIGYINDDTVFVYEPDIQKTTKKMILNDIDGWRNDDGTYGNEDTSIIIAYDNGDVVNIDTNYDELGGKKYKKSGIIGAAISTADYEMVWGDEINKRTGKRTPIQTWSEDGESGMTNTYSGYKATGKYNVRTKTTYNNPNGRGGYKTKREILRRSTIEKLR